MYSVDIKSIRKSMKLSQLDMAKILDISQPYLSEVEQGKRPITDHIATKIKTYIDEHDLPITISEEPGATYPGLSDKKNECPEFNEFLNADRRYRIPDDNAIAGYRSGTILALKELTMKDYIPLGILYLIETATDRMELLRYITALDRTSGLIRIAFDLNGRFEQEFPLSEIKRIYQIKSVFTQKL
jgi:transcriptional regulator with XRE-family HTH domain